MTLKEAIKILREHNEWRLGAWIQEINPTLIGIAIDLILEHIEDK